MSKKAMAKCPLPTFLKGKPSAKPAAPQAPVIQPIKVIVIKTQPKAKYW